MSFTVVPLFRLDLPTGARIPFGCVFSIRELPDWLRKDEEILNKLPWEDRVSVADAKHAFVSEYEADSIGYPDPDWTGTQPKSIQDLRFQSAMLALAWRYG